MRRALYARLEEVLGDEQAGTLMAYLPTVDGARMATKEDVEALGRTVDAGRMGRLDGRMDRLDDRMHDLHLFLHQQSRTFVATTIASMITLSAVAFGAAALI